MLLALLSWKLAPTGNYAELSSDATLAKTDLFLLDNTVIAGVMLAKLT